MKWDNSFGSLSSASGNLKTEAEPNGKTNRHAAAGGGGFDSSAVGRSLFLSPSSVSGGSAIDDARVIAALETYLEAMRAGHPWSREAFLAEHSEIAVALGECISGLDFIQGAADGLARSQLGSPGRTAEVIPPYAQLGEYRIVREVGRGGMGVVYEAEQISLGRRVALKVLPFTAAIDPKQRQRFQIEAHAAAQLHHPHIVPIFGVGCDHGIHYYAMQFVEGRSLSAIIRDLRQCEAAHAGTDARTSAIDLDQPSSESTHVDRSYCRNVARLGVEAAEALEHAHSLGIVHRDIKPANLLIDPHDALWITDFGLARCTNDLSLTHTGDMVGTLRYTSPEQAQVRGGVVDQRTDIYALGVTLYELLTLQPAFNGRDHQELFRQIAQDEPVSPRRLNPAVPRDLETIVLKAIAKDPAARYTRAQELADDLRRFMEDQPIMARRPGLLERTVRWGQRHKDLVGTAAVILVLALTVGTAATWVQVRKTDAANRRTDAFIIRSFPFLDRAANDEISGALKLFGAQGPAASAEASRKLEEALSIFQYAIALPPEDANSRTVIARAHTRLGYARWMLSMIKSTQAGPEPRLIADAQVDFRKSIGMLEKLLADSPDDGSLRRYLANALGLGNLGCCLRSESRLNEAEPVYRRSIDLLRELLGVTGSSGPLDGKGNPSVSSEAMDLTYLVESVQNLASMQDAKGKKAEGDGLRRQLEADVVKIAARVAGPESEPLRRTLIQQVLTAQRPQGDQDARRDAMTIYRLAAIIDPESALACNNLAWSLSNNPDDPWYDPARGLVLARKAVELEPNTSLYLNSLGVAAYRAGDFKTATRALEQSIGSLETGAHDYFFLAMTYWQQGNKKAAREFYARAVAWTEKNRPKDPELKRFRAEADALFGEPCPKAKASGSARAKVATTCDDCAE